MSERLQITVDGIRLVCHVSGVPDAPALVLLHGLGDDGGTWEEVGEEFAQYFRVFALDLRGHGQSDRPGAYSFELMRDDVLGVLEQLRLDRVNLLGHSMGGTVAYLIAEKEPGRIIRLILEDTPPPWPWERAVPERPDAPVPFDWAVVPAIYGQLSHPDPAWWDRVTEITAPTLIIGGGPDSHIPQDKLEEAAARLPHGTFRVIPAGHDVHTARPAEFTAAVLGFLRSGDRAPGASLLDDLRANLSRGDIVRYLGEFGSLAGSDSSSRKLAEATGGHVDLAIPAHRTAAITWLRAWGCRHLRRADTTRTSEALRIWWNDWGSRLPGEHETLTGLGEAELVLAGQAYDALRATPAARRTVRGHELDVAFGDTATAKLLFALRPQAFPPWDEAIRLAFGRPGGGTAYVRMLRLSAAALDGLAQRLSVPVGDLSEVLGRPGSSPPKLVDEYLLIRIAKGR